MHISLESIFKDAAHLQDEIHREQALREKIYGLLVIAVACSGLYGLVMGFHHSLAQALSSAVKVPLLFMATLAICLPTLHFVGLLFGSRVRFLQSLAVLLWGIAVMSVLLGAFAPVSLFFSMSQPRYEFILLMHVAIFAFCGTASLVIIKRNMNALTAGEKTNAPSHLQTAVALYSISKSQKDLHESREKAHNDDPETGEDKPDGAQAAHEVSTQATPPSPASAAPTEAAPPFFLTIWMGLYMFVGAQMAYILSPFVGREKAFVLVNSESGNFFLAVFRAIANILGS